MMTSLTRGRQLILATNPASDSSLTNDSVSSSGMSAHLGINSQPSHAMPTGVVSEGLGFAFTDLPWLNTPLTNNAVSKAASCQFLD
jgi:hypothetical protein